MDYLNGAILGNKGYDNSFSITLTDDEGSPVTGITCMLNMGELKVLGNYDEENKCYWFTVPAEFAKGSQMYNITVDGETLQFSDKFRFI